MFILDYILSSSETKVVDKVIEGHKYKLISERYSFFKTGDIVIALEDGEDGAYCILADKCDSIEYNVYDYGIASAKDLIEVE